MYATFEYTGIGSSAVCVYVCVRVHVCVYELVHVCVCMSGSANIFKHNHETKDILTHTSEHCMMYRTMCTCRSFAYNQLHLAQYHTCVRVCVCVFVRVCMCTSACVCTHVLVHTYTSTQLHTDEVKRSPTCAYTHAHKCIMNKYGRVMALTDENA